MMEAERIFGSLEIPTPRELQHALAELSRVPPEELEEVAGPPGVFPYGRTALFRSDHVEVLVMNWAPDRRCSPHDHGNSFGWIDIVCGTADHLLYTLDQSDVPVLYLERQERAGSLYFSPRGQVHAMGNRTADLMLTLHAYAPPIANMVVYDLENCAKCVVSDDCGAWWPPEQRQRLREYRLNSGRSLGLARTDISDSGAR